MNLAQAVLHRHSFRGFTADPVPDQVLEDVFQLAAQAPSNCNLQPWHVHVVSGEACDRMRAKLTEAAMANPRGNPDFEWLGRFDGVYKMRQVAAALGLWEHQGVERTDKAKRLWSWMRNFEFFGAPHVAFVFFSDQFPEQLRIAADVGMYAQTLMLALRSVGLGSCPQTALSFYPDVVRAELGVDESYRLLMGISFGHIDDADPANEFRAGRAPLAETTTFHR